jgi:diacylglycerol kinase (ATP)
VTSPFGPLTVIADPAAGRGRVADELPVLERALASHDLEYDLTVARAPEEATALASEALAGGRRFLVAVGDDRTVQDVVNGMFLDGRPIVEEAVLGVIPAGSGCDLMKSFGLPDDTVRACRHLVGDNTYPFDLMKIACTGEDGERLMRYAANLAEVGFGGAVARRLGRNPTPPAGPRRFLAFWSAYVRSKPVRVRVEADKKTWEGSAFNVIVGNGQFASGGMRLSPRSFPGDGVLDALVFAGPRTDAYTMLPRIYRHGDHVPDPNIHEFRAKIRIAVDAERSLALVADGRPLGHTPASFQVVPRQILFKL